MVIWPPIESWVIRPKDGSLWATWHKELPSDHGNERSGTPGASKCCETWWSDDLREALFGGRGLGIEAGRCERGGGGKRHTETERERERDPCLVTVETFTDTPPGRAAKIISASWGIHKHERRAQQAGPWVLHASLFSPLSAAPPLLFNFSFHSSLHNAAFKSVCAVCLGQGAGGKEAKA